MLQLVQVTSAPSARQRLDQHGGLDGHVQAAGDARALERLLRAVLRAQRHQAGHLVLGDLDLFAAPVGEPDVGDPIALAFLGGDSALFTALGRTGFLNALHDNRLLFYLCDAFRSYPLTGEIPSYYRG